ncbi:hypothetical protein F8388_003734 [Cannabis sativa]|uniref:Uncharacterized protein n=1 Tax=Cannabis sativa TaxID=3483 RepID=A0A7J6F759_CANSA|nr:hypothetical protein F8388_003734 [Cannabis sativa]
MEHAFGDYLQKLFSATNTYRILKIRVKNSKVGVVYFYASIKVGHAGSALTNVDHGSSSP